MSLLVKNDKKPKTIDINCFWCGCKYARYVKPYDYNNNLYECFECGEYFIREIDYERVSQKRQS